GLWGQFSGAEGAATRQALFRQLHQEALGRSGVRPNFGLRPALVPPHPAPPPLPFPIQRPPALD
ncbi:MAG: hypothetical protein ACKO28_08825, partial [Cyanobium sp.]